jgi:hypothetical protein
LEKNIKPSPKVGFAFNTMDRVNSTLKSLTTIDSDKGFDILWVDGSKSPEGKALATTYRLKNSPIVERHLNVRGGPDAAIRFGLKRLLDLNYAYCGIIENDILFKPGWFKELLNLFSLANRDGFKVGAATVRNFDSRVIEYRSGFTTNWCIGAGMVLFTREAAQIIVDEYDSLYTTARKICRFYAEFYGVDLRGNWDLWLDLIDRTLSPDWGFSMLLQRKGMVSVGSIPNMAYDTGVDVKNVLKTHYVTTDKCNYGFSSKRVTPYSLKWIQSVDLPFSMAEKVVQKTPFLYFAYRYVELALMKKKTRKR